MKLLELLIRGDIDNLVAGLSKAGLCLIDSSDFGNTYYKVLKYCAKVGYHKVCLIDPNDFFHPHFGRFPTINPYSTTAPRMQLNVRGFGNDANSVEGDDFSRTAKIQDYLTSVISLLHESESTLYDAKYFFSRKNDFYRIDAKHFWIKFRTLSLTIQPSPLLTFFAADDTQFANDFGSTIRRLRPVLSVEPLNLMIGSNTAPLNFQKMIDEGWVILCDLYPQVWDVPQQRFLGTLCHKRSHPCQLSSD